MNCVNCSIQLGIVDAELEEVTVSIYAGKYNLKKEDNSFVYDERLDEEGFEDFKNGDKIFLCPVCSSIGAV